MSVLACKYIVFTLSLFLIKMETEHFQSTLTAALLLVKASTSESDNVLVGLRSCSTLVLPDIHHRDLYPKKGKMNKRVG